jgi:glycosyltransferase involved in cell wall biosynthesis
MKKRILFVNDEMVVGGVSRVLNNLLGKLDLNKYDIDLLVLHKHGDMLKEIPEGINIIEGSEFFNVCDITIEECRKLGIKKTLRKYKFYHLLKSGYIVDRIIKERKRMNLPKYDVEIAFKEGFCSIFTACGNSTLKLNWIHADYKVKNYAERYMSTMKRILPRFDYHISVSNVAGKSFKEIFGLAKVMTIHNIINDEYVIEKAKEDVDFRDQQLSFIAVGRLHPQKSYDRLIDACARLNNESYKYQVYILGDGELKEDLIKQMKVLNVDNIHLLGNQTNPFKYVKQADCLLLSSIYEGLPTVVYEALILHIPVISTRVAGVDEQLSEETGIISENSTEGIYLMMKEVMDDPEKLKMFKNNIKDYKYKNDDIVKTVESLFDSESVRL